MKYPSSLYCVDNHQIPPDLAVIYKEYLTLRGLLIKAQEDEPPNKPRGGESQREAEDHFCYRFLNSVSRILRLIIDHPEYFPMISADLLQIMSQGEIRILDAPSGAGAASLALITGIAELRRQGHIPTLPLTVHITAADLSETALEINREMATRLKAKMQEAGIILKIESIRWDASVAPETSKLCDNWLSPIHQVNEYLLIISNFSETARGPMAQFQRSIQHIGERILNHRPYTMLWVEPDSNINNELVRRIKQFFSHIPTLLGFVSRPAMKIRYKWTCPIKQKDISSGVHLVQYERN